MITKEQVNEAQKLWGDGVVKIGALKDSRELESCIATEDELNIRDWKQGFEDEWTVERVFVIE